jgi:predicted NAD-dependent protein-ADP-ribosyltransferase YbiA (DUF1768 family)
MKTILRASRIVLTPETDEERLALASWSSTHDDFAFATLTKSGSSATLIALGQRDEACRAPINVTSTSPDPIRLIANFAPTPFELDGGVYSCVEAFWQSLRFPIDERPRIAALDGATAKRESTRKPYGNYVLYCGRTIPVGTYQHWQLMRRACRAKFEQNVDARAALLGTGSRPLVHCIRPDSRTIPGVIVADIWMKLRTILRRHSKR